MEFRNINVNPKNKKTCDCVIRAITQATNNTWEETYEILCEIGKNMCDMPNSKAVFSNYLEDYLGWEKHKMPKQQKGKVMKNGEIVPRMGRMTIAEFSEKNPKGCFIIGVSKHLTYLEDGVLLDTWNCSSKSMGNYWTC